jgi:hypothetical protein
MRLLDININPTLFETHYLCHCGVQYYLSRGELFQNVCLIGSWDDSIWQYIVSSADEYNFDRT